MLLMMMRWRRQLELRVPASVCPSSQQLPLPSCQASGRVCGEVENEWEEERTLEMVGRGGRAAAERQKRRLRLRVLQVLIAVRWASPLSRIMKYRYRDSVV